MSGSFRLVAVKRPWIPEWLYACIVQSFWRPVCVRQPLRWLLHKELPSNGDAWESGADESDKEECI